MTSKITRKQLGENIQSIRQLKNISRKSMAMDLDISHRSYSAIENGEVPITIERLQEIAEILTVDFIKILGYSSEKIFSQVVHQHSGNNGENINHKEINNDLSLIKELLIAKDETIKLLKEQLNIKNP